MTHSNEAVIIILCNNTAVITLGCLYECSERSEKSNQEIGSTGWSYQTGHYKKILPIWDEFGIIKVLLSLQRSKYDILFCSCAIKSPKLAENLIPMHDPTKSLHTKKTTRCTRWVMVREYHHPSLCAEEHMTFSFGRSTKMLCRCLMTSLQCSIAFTLPAFP